DQDAAGAVPGNDHGPTVSPLSDRRSAIQAEPGLAARRPVATITPRLQDRLDVAGVINVFGRHRLRGVLDAPLLVARGQEGQNQAQREQQESGIAARSEYRLHAEAFSIAGNLCATQWLHGRASGGCRGRFYLSKTPASEKGRCPGGARFPRNARSTCLDPV